MSQHPTTTPPSNLYEYTVSELSAVLKTTVEERFGHVRLRAEISGFKRHASGHLYFTLKDDIACLDAVCWRTSGGKLGLQPEDGLEVIVTGRLTTYPGRSKYQIVVETMELAGQGALLKMLEERKKRLAAEGLFDPARKKPLPFLPGVIGVITSPTGAVIRDILHRLKDRYPCRVLLWPVAVQGETAAAEVTAAIQGFNRLSAGGTVPRPDVIIVARGGGSIEDLMAFNEEIVVRAAAESAIPLLSAVGHETDTTLIDFAADIRAPTPTAAAEMAVPIRTNLVEELIDLGRRAIGGLGRYVGERRLHLDGLARGLLDPRRLLETKSQKLDDETDRLALAARNLIERQGQKISQLTGRLRSPTEIYRRSLEGLTRTAPLMLRAIQQNLRATERHMMATGALLESLSYKRILDRGFVLVLSADGHPILRATEAKAGAEVALTFADGTASAQILAGPKGSTPSKPRRQATPPSQGKLI